MNLRGCITASPMIGGYRRAIPVDPVVIIDPPRRRERVLPAIPATAEFGNPVNNWEPSDDFKRQEAAIRDATVCDATVWFAIGIVGILGWRALLS